MSRQYRLEQNNGFAWLVFAFFVVAYLLPLGVRDLAVPDETRYAEIPREMIVSGDWISSHLNGLRYFEKPVLGYWIQAGSILLFGENNFAVRLPSALSVGLSALLIGILVFRMGRKVGDEQRSTAVLAALIYLSCFEVFGVGCTAVLDSLFSFFLTASIAMFYWATEYRPRSQSERRTLLLSGFFSGLAFLSKGFLGFALPALVLGPYLVWQRRWRDLIRMSWLPILGAVLIALPWAVLIHLREPDFWRFFFWNEHIRRFLADNAQHAESFWYFFLIAPAMFLPWTVLLPAAVPGISKLAHDQSVQGRLVRLSLCWLVLPFVFFSVSEGKLLTYILPCFPPFALLMAMGLTWVFQEEQHNRLVQGGLVFGLFFFSLLLPAFVYLQLNGFEGVRLYDRPWKPVLAVSGLLFLLFSFSKAFKARAGKQKILLLGLAPLPLFFLAHFIVPDSTIEAKMPASLLEQHAHSITDKDLVLADDNTIRAVCWYLKRSDIILVEKDGELEYGLGYADAENRLLDPQSAAELIKHNRGRAVLIARVRKIEKWRNQLPRPDFQAVSGPSGYAVWKF
ncbi:MAG: phospholipid carrier-dependent glycosyltransferase [Desulfohalobiaceae bacterium]|nr:phospholipid carrier-dependent glycosyltransferase [Desulfohalobiaceae bacterium]